MASFDWVSDRTSSADVRVITLAKNGIMSMKTLTGHIPSFSFGSRNSFTITSADGPLTTLPPPSTDPKLSGVPEPNHTRNTKREVNIVRDDGESSDDGSFKENLKQQAARKDSMTPMDFMFDPRDILRRDISVTMRRRAEKGYGLDVCRPCFVLIVLLT